MSGYVPRKTVAGVIRRAQGCCERCGIRVLEHEAPELDDRGFAWSVQHRRPAGMGGTRSPEYNSPANVALLCGSGTTGCHGWVESNRLKARDEEGWLVWQSQDPADTPVRLHGGRLVYLTGDWRYDDERRPT